jgi:hypothetical protein
MTIQGAAAKDDWLTEARLSPRPRRAIGSWRRRSKSVAGREHPVARAIESIGIVLLATLGYLALGEVAARIALHAPLFASQDFRHARATATINKAIHYDSLLGWRLKPHIKTAGFNTLDYGFRSNGDADAQVRPGGVLAIGSSFTAGSEVGDADSWPARLQHLTGWNVNNAGQGGYEADQIVLLGEQLLPLIRPQVLVVDLIPGAIIGTGYSAVGWHKPYFTIENGALVAHNSRVPPSEPDDAKPFGIKQLLGHLAVIDRFMAAFFPSVWFTADGSTFITVSADEVGVTCRLLERLQRKTDAAGTRLLLYLQYSGPEIVDGSRMANAAGGRVYQLKRWIKTTLKPLLMNTPPGAPDWDEASREVGACARGLGIETVDELASLQAVYEKNPNDLRKYYQIEPDGTMGHKSPFGNTDVATRVAAAIGELDPAAQKSK